MKLFQVNRMIRHDRCNTSHFIKEIKDEHGRLITYRYLGNTPMLKCSPFYPEFLEYRQQGSVTRPCYEL